MEFPLGSLWLAGTTPRQKKIATLLLWSWGSRGLKSSNIAFELGAHNERVKTIVNKREYVFRSPENDHRSSGSATCDQHKCMHYQLGLGVLGPVSLHQVESVQDIQSITMLLTPLSLCMIKSLELPRVVGPSGVIWPLPTLQDPPLWGGLGVLEGANHCM